MEEAFALGAEDGSSFHYRLGQEQSIDKTAAFIGMDHHVCLLDRNTPNQMSRRMSALPKCVFSVEGGL